ncbi:MAG: NUDIX hydrolase [Thermodesulfobacteriota bacterium]|nr:NUDIX hydrolase [Thermodesulfobacteriota bacterium]
MTPREYPESPQTAVGAIVVKDEKVLMVKRVRAPGEGLWAIPGGRVKLGETLEQAAEREVKEETGIVICARGPVYTFDLIEHDAAGRVRFHYVIVDLLADYVSGRLKPGDDASEARWVRAEELDALPARDRTKDLLKRLTDLGRSS